MMRGPFVVVVPIIALALTCLAGPAHAATDDENFDIDMIVTFSGKCVTFNVAGRDLPCRAVKYFHGQGGRAYFTVAVDDPADKGHIVSFSGDRARRESDLYELSVDQMLLNSRDRPRVNGLRVPLVKPGSGFCRQLGDVERKKITAISCKATDKEGLKYELTFEADGEPALVQTIVREPAEVAKRRKRLRTLTVCRRRAAEANIMPRDATSYIIQCLEEGGVPTDDQ